MSAVLKSEAKQEIPTLALYDPVGVVDLYREYLAETGDPGAAASLVVATVQSKQRINKKKHGSQSVLTPPQVAKQLSVDPATVINWIRSGELKASNVGKGAQRPRYRILRGDLDAFLESRQPQALVTKKRQSKVVAGDIEFFS